MYCLDSLNSTEKKDDESINRESLKVAGEAETVIHRRLQLNLLPCMPTKAQGIKNEKCVVNDLESEIEMNAKL